MNHNSNLSLANTVLEGTPIWTEITEMPVIKFIMTNEGNLQVSNIVNLFDELMYFSNEFLNTLFIWCTSGANHEV